jgi:hypothetical protein
MELIDKKIKELYKTKALFCKYQKLDYTTHARLRKKFVNWINQINDYLEPLDLEIQIAPKRKSDEPDYE